MSHEAHRTQRKNASSIEREKDGVREAQRKQDALPARKEDSGAPCWLL
jgi:hypothetical protein